MGALAAATVVVAIATVGPEAAAQSEGRVVTARAGVVQQTVSGTGNLAPANQVDLGFSTSGTVEKVFVEAGQHVEAGQLIARLDDARQKVAVAQAEAALDSARTALDDAENSNATASTTGTTSAASTPAVAAPVLVGARATSRVVPPAAETRFAAVDAPGSYDGGPRLRADAARSTNGAGSGATAIAVAFKAAATTGTGATGTGATPSTSTTSSPATSATPTTTSAAPSTSSSAAPTTTQATPTTTNESGARATGSGRSSGSSGAATSSGARSGGGSSAGASSGTASGTTGSGAGASSGGSGSATSVASAEAAVASAKLDVQDAEEALEDTRLRAPVAGTITALDGSAGQTVSGAGSSSSSTSSSGSGSAAAAGTGATTGSGSGGGTSSGGSSSTTGSSSSSSSFATLAQLSRLDLEVSFSESDIGDLKVGQAASVTVTALDGVELAAKVTAIGTTSTSSSGVVSYPVTLAVTQKADGVLPGMSASAEVVTAQAKGISVPSQAISGRTVTVRKGGEDTRTAVTTGVVGDTSTQVLSGLAAGDQVVLPALSTTTSSGGGTSSGRGGAAGGLGGGGFGGGGAGFGGGPPGGGRN